jgi:putative PIN family toxin of toxin-antitoxin system
LKPNSTSGGQRGGLDRRHRRLDLRLRRAKSKQPSGASPVACRRSTHRLILSQDVEDEYREVIFRRKFDRFVSVERRQRILDIVVVAAERIEPTETVRECQDPKDDKYLALAAAARADVIVSSDARHLLSMHPWRGIRILSPADYLALG